MWREDWISNVIERWTGWFDVFRASGLEVWEVGRGMVMGEDAIARLAASAVSKMATMGRFGSVVVLLVSYWNRR